MGYAPAAPVTQNINVVPRANFSIKPLPPNETVDRRDPAGFVLELDSLNGFNGNVRLSCSGGPARTLCIVFPQTVKLNGARVRYCGHQVSSRRRGWKLFLHLHRRLRIVDQLRHGHYDREIASGAD